jgi:RNA polymerase sigma-70 factor (ECF subfamily)
MVSSVVDDDDQVPVSSADDDIALVVRTAQGDVTAFGRLYDRYARTVYTLAVHLLGGSEAEEAVQDIFLRLWNKADQFDATRGTFAGWFMTIARNHMFRQLGTRNRRQRVELAEDIDQILAQTADPRVDIEEQAWLLEQGQAALAALNELPAEQRHVLVLAYFGGLSQSAIAQHLDLPLGTIKKRTRLGLHKLRQALAPGRLANSATIDPESTHSSPTKARMTDGL